MTYYEELGVAPTASDDEIRKAYKHLARLVHPDQCGDEATRRLAELQMKRLNGILEVLNDKATRDRYDRSLAALALAVLGEPLPSTPRLWDARWTPRAAIAAGAAILILMLMLPPPSQPVSPPAIPEIAGAVAPHAPRAEHRSPASRRTRPAGLEPEWEPLATYAYESHVPIPPLPFTERPVELDPRLATDDSGRAGAGSPLAGDWLFVPAASVDTLGYPPEYIELRLRREGSVLRGHYQARYRVTDQAISPNVTFRFEGQLGTDGGTLPWNGASGAKGEVTLHLLPDGDLEVTWEAEKLGKELGLISGRATLVRKLE